MAPSRGSAVSTNGSLYNDSTDDAEERPLQQQSAYAEAQRTLAERAAQPQNFTIRGLVCGLVIGSIIAFSNMYFGLQTGWISGMSMPSALISFAFFEFTGRVRLPFQGPRKLPFSPVENVFILSVAGSVGTMPLGCGFVGVIPALEYLLKPEENGPLHIPLGKLCIFAAGICLFGVVVAVPLRKEVIIREKLRFPTGTATALMIGVLHGQKAGATVIKQEEPARADHGEVDESQALIDEDEDDHQPPQQPPIFRAGSTDCKDGDWKARIKSMTLAFAFSASYTIFSYFVPQIRSIPIFGPVLAERWLWTLNPSPAYVAQGIIMGPSITFHMLLGAILGWGILSPLAKSRGWAPGPIGDWETGSKGWIVWVSLAIMLVDAIVSLGFLVARPLLYYGPSTISAITHAIQHRDINQLWTHSTGHAHATATPTSSTPLINSSGISKPKSFADVDDDDLPEADAPPEHQISTKAFVLWTFVSLGLYFASIHLAFPGLMPFSATILALVLASFLSIMGVRALGETDLNPVSGISKITQLAFAAVIPASNPNAVPINLLAGAIAESGALQAGDLMSDLKTGHLLGAAPYAQFYAQLIGSVFGAVVSAAAYRLYSNVYTLPSKQFQMPTAYVWVFTARLVTGRGLPPRAAEFALVAAAIFAVLTALRILARRRPWQAYIPSGIAVAVGMYNQPNFTLARAVGGLVAWWWVRWRGRDSTDVIVIASGLILGEGLFSIVNLGLASAHVPHA